MTKHTRTHTHRCACNRNGGVREQELLLVKLSVSRNIDRRSEHGYVKRKGGGREVVRVEEGRG